VSSPPARRTSSLLIASVSALVAVIGITLAVLVYAKKRLKPVEPAILEQGWHYDRAVSEFMGGPGRQAFEATAWFDATVVDGAVNGTGRRVGELAQVVPDVHRPDWCGLRRDRRPRCRAPHGLVPVPGGAVMSAARGGIRGDPRLPDPHRARAGAGHRRPRRHAAVQAPTRVRQVGTRSSRRCSPRRSACGCSSASSRVRPASSSCPSTPGSNRGVSRGTSASTASRCSSWCSPGCCSRSPSSGSIRTTTRSPTWPGCCCCRPV
jgi:hypothetical protein